MANAILTEEQTAEISETIRRFMDHYHWNPQGSDYSCLYCHKELEPKAHTIVHKDDCDGVRFLKLLGG